MNKGDHWELRIIYCFLRLQQRITLIVFTLLNTVLSILVYYDIHVENQFARIICFCFYLLMHADKTTTTLLSLRLSSLRMQIAMWILFQIYVCIVVDWLMIHIILLAGKFVMNKLIQFIRVLYWLEAQIDEIIGTENLIVVIGYTI